MMALDIYDDCYLRIIDRRRQCEGSVSYGSLRETRRVAKTYGIHRSSSCPLRHFGRVDPEGSGSLSALALVMASGTARLIQHVLICRSGAGKSLHWLVTLSYDHAESVVLVLPEGLGLPTMKLNRGALRPDASGEKLRLEGVLL